MDRAVLASCVLATATALAPLPPSSLPVMDASTMARTIWRQRELWATDLHAIVPCGEGPPRYRLAYMAMRNRAEVLRLMLAEAECPYEFEIVGFKNWERGVKATTPHGKLPVLRAYDGVADLGQEGAITRFLARELGLAGRGPAEEARVDALYHLWFATLRNQGVSHSGEHFSVAALKVAAPTADRPRYEEVYRLDDLSRADRSLAALGFFEATLEKTGTGYLVGDAPTVADLGLFYVLYELAEDDKVPDFAVKFALPRLGAFLDRVAARPGIRAFLESPARIPRYERDPNGASTYAYVPGRASPAR